MEPAIARKGALNRVLRVWIFIYKNLSLKKDMNWQRNGGTATDPKRHMPESVFQIPYERADPSENENDEQENWPEVT